MREQNLNTGAIRPKIQERVFSIKVKVNGGNTTSQIVQDTDTNQLSYEKKSEFESTWKLYRLGDSDSDRVPFRLLVGKDLHVGTCSTVS